MAAGRRAVLKLYEDLIKESKKWHSYNYREYSLRKIRHEFRNNRCISDPQKIDEFYKNGLESLALIKRQVTVGNLYATRPLVIETKKVNENMQSIGQ